MPRWNTEFKIYAPIKLDRGLVRQTRTALKVIDDDNPIFTNITLREHPNERHFSLGYFYVALDILADTQKQSLDIAQVYVSQLCDLLSFVTRVGAENLYSSDSDNTRNVSGRVTNSRSEFTSNRFLTSEEWDWIIKSLPYLRDHEPRFMAACSWYRRGLSCDNITEKICCFWRVI